MDSISLTSLKPLHKPYFEKWWQYHYLIRLTSGDHTQITDEQINTYFDVMLQDKDWHDYMIALNDTIIGHICLLNIMIKGMCRKQ